MNKAVVQISELVKNSINKELNNAVAVFYSGDEFCSAVQNLRNSALYGRWYYSYSPHEAHVPGTALNINPVLVFSLLGKTVAAMDLSLPSNENPGFDVLFDEVFLSGLNLDIVSSNLVPGALTFIDDVPPGGEIIGSTLVKEVFVFNDEGGDNLVMTTSEGTDFIGAFSMLSKVWTFPIDVEFHFDYFIIIRVSVLVTNGLGVVTDGLIIYINSYETLAFPVAVVDFAGHENVKIRLNGGYDDGGVPPGGLHVWRHLDGSEFSLTPPQIMDIVFDPVFE